MKYTYSFEVCLDENRKFHREVEVLFTYLKTRIAKIFTEEEFNKFRAILLKEGFRLKEIERLPYPLPVEKIY